MICMDKVFWQIQMSDYFLEPGALNILMSKSIILVSLQSQRVPLQEAQIDYTCVLL